MTASQIKIGKVTLNRRLGCLEDREGKAQHLRPKSYRVLEVLAERRGELVSKDDLAAAAWTDTTASDESLSQCISDIRRALGKDDAGLLRTVPRRGFVLESEPPVSETRPVPARLDAAVAVLTIAAVAGLAVAYWHPRPQPDTTVAAPVRGAAESDAGSHAPVILDWRDRTANDSFRAELEGVLAADPRDARAWAELGHTYWREVKFSAWGGGRRELDQALTALERSLQLGGGAAAYRVLAEIRLEAPFPGSRSPVDALAAARAALDLAPDDPDSLAILADALVRNGYADEAVPIIEQALGAVASPPDRYREIAGLSYLVSGEPAKAVEEFGRLHGAGTFSGERDYMGWFLAASLAHAGRIDEASSVLEQARHKRPEKTIQGVSLTLGHLNDRHALDVVLDGLRLAGMPG
jgi:DNA-binding winged helix-turn-helix (wHTH) protein